MSIQAQSISLFTSHLPPLLPAQGPLSMPLTHLVIGQIAPVTSSLHSPQAAHRSSQTPHSLDAPIKDVLTPGKTGMPGKRSATTCTPVPQPSERTASTSSTLSLSMSRNSKSHCRFTVYSRKL